MSLFLSHNEINILNALAEIVVIIDEQWLIRFFNKSAETVFRCSYQDVVGKNVNVLMPVTIRAHHDGYIQNYLDIQTPSFLGIGGRELKAQRLDGEIFDVELMVSETSIGDERYFIGSMRDITCKKKEENKARLLETRLSNAQRIARLGNWEWNMKQDQLWWSDEVYRIFGRAKDQGTLDLSSLMSAVYPEDHQVILQAVDKAVKTRTPYKVRHRILRPDGEMRIVDEQGEVHYATNGDAVALSGTVQNVTEQVNIELQLQKAMRLESVDRLSSGIAHDFNNLLGVIMGNMEILHQKLPATELSFEIDNAMAAAQKGADLVKRLMAFTSKQVLNAEMVDIAEKVVAFRSLIERTVPASITLEFNCPEDICFSALDISQFENAVLNLTINARDAMPDGGHLAYSVAREDLQTEILRGGTLVSPGKYVSISVCDSGTGIEPNILHRILEPFFTTKADGQGSGLGLSMVYGFVNQSGGHFCIDTALGKGTNITLMFPAMEPHEKSPSVKHDNVVCKDQVKSEEIKVLVVEDEEMLRKLLHMHLTMKGFDVLVDGEAREALSLMESNDDIRLVITDMTLPGGLSGRDLGERIERDYPQIRKISMSGYFNQVQGEQSIDKLFDEFIPKPFKMEDLTEVISRVL